MKLKSILRHNSAEQDIEKAKEYYLSEASADVALKFINALELSIAQIRRQPNIGSLRYAHQLNIPELRNWQIKGFPYLIFYTNLQEHVFVYRILHSQSDIPDWLSDD